MKLSICIAKAVYFDAISMSYYLLFLNLVFIWNGYSSLLNSVEIYSCLFSFLQCGYHNFKICPLSGISCEYWKVDVDVYVDMPIDIEPWSWRNLFLPPIILSYNVDHVNILIFVPNNLFFCKLAFRDRSWVGSYPPSYPQWHKSS